MTNAEQQVEAARPLRAIIVEDTPDDAALLLRALRRAGFVPDYVRVQTEEELDQALRAGQWDVVLSDYTLPDFSGLIALHQVRAFDPDMPFIIISGNIGEDVAVAAMKAGAHDYIIKGNLTRLGAAIDRELRETEMRRARRSDEQALLHARLRLQALSNRMLEMQEAERRHIARELHDEIGQSLTAIKLNLEALARRLGDDKVRSLADEIAGVAGEVLDQVRRLSLDLRPPQLDDLGLRAALHWLVKRHSREGGPAIELEAPEDLPRLGTQAETACFRIAQEALTNVLRHSDAKTVRILLDAKDGHCSLEVRDDGRGFDLAAARAKALEGASLGLVGMNERVTLAGGEIRIASHVGEGTRLLARFPLPTDAAEGARA
ncbi:MAG: response regulator [Betaproteobacteria bacterium]|jgi:signal transduction histidine kinase|nr:response regulator [Betaproteobacteria bacterium]